jgi:hypothetical protein
MYLFFVSTDLHYSAMHSVLDRRGRVSKPLDWGFPLPHHWHGNSVARDTQNTIEICIWLYTRLNTVRAVMPRDIKILIYIQSVASQNSVMYIKGIYTFFITLKRINDSEQKFSFVAC